MHIRRGALGWGVFLILAGAIPLAVRGGYLSEAQVSDLWTLWPMILIGLGIGLLLGRTRFEFIGGLIVAATFGLMVGGLLSGGMGGVSTGACGSPNGATAFPERAGAFSARAATIDVEADCGSVTIATGPGNDWRAAGEDRDGRGPQVDAGADSLNIRTTDGGDLFGIFSARSTWRITVPTGPRIDLDVELNAGSATVDLAGAAIGSATIGLNAGSTTLDLGSVRELRELQVEVNAGSAGITLPNVSMTGSVQANAGSVRLCAPAGAGLKLQTGDSVAASYGYGDHGLIQDGSTWTTPGYDDAAVRIDLRTEGNAASFTLDPEVGCDG